MNALFAFLAMTFLLLSPLLSETIAAIHRTVAARLERHARGLAARGADRVEHFLAAAHAAAAAATAAATTTSAAGGLLGGPARRAPLGLIREPELSEPLLLSRRERERRSAIHTRQLLVAVHALNPIKPVPPDAGGKLSDYNRKSPPWQTKSNLIFRPSPRFPAGPFLWVKYP